MELPVEEMVVRYRAGASESDLARNLGVSRTTVHRRLLKAGVVVRSVRAANALRGHKEFPEVETAVELIDGMMLGDGWLEGNPNSAARFCLSQRSGRKEWLVQLQAEWAALGVESRFSLREPRDHVLKDRVVRSSRADMLRSLKYATLSRQRERWYPGGIKVVPEDVRLTPVALAHWYWGDGALENNGYRMAFCTDGFTWEECKRLVGRLHTLYGWEGRIHSHRGKPKIVLQRREDREALVELIRPLCPPCFTYKLDTKKKALSKIDAVENEICRLKKSGWKYADLDKHFGMKKGWAGWACRQLNIKKETICPG